MQILFNSQADLTSAKPPSVVTILRRHFFRRFFDNDTVALEAETETTVVRALAAVAVPCLMVAFWLLPRYGGGHRLLNGALDTWGIAADRYFFTLYSFGIMGAVATVEWEMLFPDRADFLVLLPLPLRPRELFRAKGLALLSFLGLFLAAANVFALILFSAESTGRDGNYLHTFAAHLAAVALAGVFSALTPLCIKGLLLCLLPSSWQRPVSAITQALLIAALILLFLLFPVFGSHMQPLLSGQTAFASYVPPLWFLGLYEYLMTGASAPAAAASLAATGLYATASAGLLAMLIYPFAWNRQRKAALEGDSSGRSSSQRTAAIPIHSLLHNTIFRRPQQRAILYFLVQTLARNVSCQLFLALYAGVGLALATATVVTLRASSEAGRPSLTLTLGQTGLHALLPLVLFWLVSGLRASFAFPIDMRSRWVFPLHLPFPGKDARSARTFTLLGCLAVTTLVLLLLLALHWSWLSLAIQALCGVCLSLLLTDLLFLGRARVPFTTPRLPGRTNLAIVLLLYTSFFPLLVIGTVSFALAAENDPSMLVRLLVAVALVHILLLVLDRYLQSNAPIGFLEEEQDDGSQTLGLAQ